MSKWQMIKFIFWASFRDPIMLTGLLCMINGSFYTAASIYYGPEFAIWMMNFTIDIMYIWVIPAYIWWPQTIVAEIVEKPGDENGTLQKIGPEYFSTTVNPRGMDRVDFDPDWKPGKP